MKLQLPTVTLLTLETRQHALAKLAIQDCLDAADFGAVVVCGTEPYGFPGERFIRCPDFDSLDTTPNSFARFFWAKLGTLFETRHALFMNYDSWIIDPGMWRDEYLDYDYIAAPSWFYEDRAQPPPFFRRTGYHVGGTGFCLVSKAMLEHIHSNPDRYPYEKPVDYVWHTTYRPKMEAEGFRWAPEELAYDFALERYRPSAHSRHFGFHDCFCWPLVLDRKRLVERLALMDRYHWDKGKLQELLAVFQQQETARLIDEVREARRNMRPVGPPVEGPFERLSSPIRSIEIRGTERGARSERLRERSGSSERTA